MKIIVILILSVIAYTQGYPQNTPKFNFNPAPPDSINNRFQYPQNSPKFNFNPPTPDPNNKRFEITHLQGGGSRGQGFDVSGGAKARLWENDRQNHQIHGTGTYSQHLGGPYGNSHPNVGAGVQYTYKFG